MPSSVSGATARSDGAGDALPIAVSNAKSAKAPNTNSPTRRPVDCEPVRAIGMRMIMSPMTPPRPTGNGQPTGTDRPASAVAAPSVPVSHHTARQPVRPVRPVRIILQPIANAGTKARADARPISCIARSAIAAPASPSLLCAGVLVAWLKLGSATDQVANASVTPATARSRTNPAIPIALRAIRRRKSVGGAKSEAVARRE